MPSTGFSHHVCLGQSTPFRRPPERARVRRTPSSVEGDGEREGERRRAAISLPTLCVGNTGRRKGWGTLRIRCGQGSVRPSGGPPATCCAPMENPQKTISGC